MVTSLKCLNFKRPQTSDLRPQKIKSTNIRFLFLILLLLIIVVPNKYNMAQSVSSCGAIIDTSFNPISGPPPVAGQCDKTSQFYSEYLLSKIILGNQAFIYIAWK